MKIFIYALQNPVTEEIRYIGKTKNPKMRFHNHMNKRHNEKTHKTNWIESLKKQKIRPIMIIIDEVSEEDWKFWERFWIQQFKCWGFELVNHTSGGDGLTMGNQTSFKKGYTPWNKYTILERVCPECKNTFKPIYNNSKQIYCCKICAGKNKKSDTQFIKNHKPWNKGKSNYKLKNKKQSLRVLQIDINTEQILNEFEGCKEAGIAMCCIPENIRRCCVGLSKTAKGYKWKYNYEQRNK